MMSCFDDPGNNSSNKPDIDLGMQFISHFLLFAIFNGWFFNYVHWPIILWTTLFILLSFTHFFLGAFHNSPDDNGLRLTLDKFVVADDDGECKANPLLKFFKIDPLKRPSYLSEVYLITESLLLSLSSIVPFFFVLPLTFPFTANIFFYFIFLGLFIHWWHIAVNYFHGRILHIRRGLALEPPYVLRRNDLWRTKEWAIG